ncbi:LysR substrate-binding domain-containing protein [Prauserella rugosa]|uniref:DNA-binding transcriptional LysR family regulator n=1 Tax=Prauserella rugosa TaxID=43354 RepID=A0A660CCW5_9PSEU|nr:LysR substrate-binding domain-containing protein [Prauserella rugosa]KMS89825.1 LysR family transcriptional regulator [Streptomyces regensis]TWH18705.1 DNA-binding transcriptional LysR family regulator [Prauserella rugosa]
MPTYTLRQLEYLVAVADAGSISAAAGALHVTPTAVASAITELERTLHTQLMVRRKAHGVVLTPTGTFLYNRATTLLRDAEELQLATASGGAELVGPLVLGCYATLAPTIVPTLMRWVAEQHPSVDLTVVTGSQAELPHRLLTGSLDLAVGYDMALPSGLDSVVLYEAPPYVLLPEDHPAASAASVSLADLAAEPMILLNFPPAQEHTLMLYADAGVTPNIVQRTTDFELTRSLVAHGFGYTILIQRPVSPTTYDGMPVVVRDISPSVRPAVVRMMWPHDVRLTDRARALVDFAEAHGDLLDPRTHQSGPRVNQT